jgi:hypothetical protein
MHADIQRRVALMMGGLGAGFVFQAASCVDLVAESVTGLLTSISGELIRNLVNEILGLGGGGLVF